METGGNSGTAWEDVSLSVKGGFSSGEYQGAITLTLLGKDIQERSRIERALLNHPNRVNGQHRTHERKDSSHRFYDILGYLIKWGGIGRCFYLRNIFRKRNFLRLVRKIHIFPENSTPPHPSRPHNYLMRQKQTHIVILEMMGISYMT